MSKTLTISRNYELENILKTNEHRRTALERIPEELCDGENLNLSRWATYLDDEVLEIACRKSKLKEHFCIDSSLLDLREMFNEDSDFWSAKKLKRGILSFRISGARRVTDFGISRLVRTYNNLKDIDLSGCSSITDVSLREIGLSCKYLQALSISSCSTIEGAGLITIAECCTKLIKLNISKCSNLQRYAITKIFYESKKLEDLNVSYLQTVSDEEIRVLAQNCSRLISLSAIDTIAISDAGILSLSQHCSDLDMLDLSRRDMAYRVTDVGMLSLGQRCASLRILKLGGCDYITDVGLSWLVHGCRALEELDLSGCTKIADAGLRSVGECCHSLTSLDISKAKHVSDIGIASVSSGCPDLKHLRCSGLYFLADPRSSSSSSKKSDPKDTFHGVIGVAAVARNCPQLESLDVSGCFRLNFAFKNHVAKRLLKLVKLNLTGCHQISVESLTAVGLACRLLEELVLADCGSCVCTSSLQAFSKTCKSIKLLNVARCEEVKASSIRHIANFSLLERLDLSGCCSLDDESLLPMCEPETVPALRQIHLVDCPSITDTGLAWLANGCKKLLLVSLKGTRITRHCSQALRDYFPFSDLLFNQNFVGFWPKPNVEDRMMIATYGKMTYGLVKIQGRIRLKLAKVRVKRIREARRRDRAIRVIQRFSRKVRGKVILRNRRQFLKHLNEQAVTVTSLFRMIQARNVVSRCRADKIHQHRTKHAKTIQAAWRKYCDFKLMLIQRARYLAFIQLRIESAIQIQCLARRFFARRVVRMRRELRDSRMRLCQRKALFIQRVVRGHLDRQHVRRLRAQLEYEEIQRNRAATVIQTAWRRFFAKLQVEALRADCLRKERAAIKVQSAIRGRLARWEYQSNITERRQAIRDWAATKIQSRFRMKHAEFVVERRRAELMERKRLEGEAATRIERRGRMWLCKLKLERLKLEHIEAMRQRVVEEMTAATKIQSLFRGRRGRALFLEKLRHKKGQWKELFDEEKRQRFFYNKLTGEIRWRMPQDLLDLIPRPICDNCCFYEAVTECKHCNEVYCSECWNQVHWGGRRKDHVFRAIYDYYDKRIDYGEGEYPSKWPTEMQQDEVQGWMLRVAPIREPVDILEEWEHYQEVEAIADNSGEVTVLKDFYFNRKTFETTYELPPPFVTAQEQLQQQQMQMQQYSYSQSDQGYGYTASGRSYAYGGDPNYPAADYGSTASARSYANSISDPNAASYGYTPSGRSYAYAGSDANSASYGYGSFEDSQSGYRAGYSNTPQYEGRPSSRGGLNRAQSTRYEEISSQRYGPGDTARSMIRSISNRSNFSGSSISPGKLNYSTSARKLV